MRCLCWQFVEFGSKFGLCGMRPAWLCNSTYLSRILQLAVALVLSRHLIFKYSSLAKLLATRRSSLAVASKGLVRVYVLEIESHGLALETLQKPVIALYLPPPLVLRERNAGFYVKISCRRAHERFSVMHRGGPCHSRTEATFRTGCHRRTYGSAKTNPEHIRSWD